MRQLQADEHWYCKLELEVVFLPKWHPPPNLSCCKRASLWLFEHSNAALLLLPTLTIWRVHNTWVHVPFYYARARHTFSLYACPSIWTLFKSTTPFRPFLESFDFLLRQQYLQVQMRQQSRISAATIAMQITDQNGTENKTHHAHIIKSN